MLLEHATIQWRTDAQGREVPFNPRFDDVYFSHEDGLRESDYVFVQGNQLHERFPTLTHNIRIGELGFGTGLNFLLTAQRFIELAPQHTQLHYLSLEQFPLSKADAARAWHSFPSLAPIADELLAQYPHPMHGIQHIHLHGGRIMLTLALGDAAELIPELQGTIDAWYLDGFAPAKNPELWTETILTHLTRLSAPSATLASFTAAGAVRRGLAEHGWEVQKTNGYGRKRDMIVAQRNAAPTSPIEKDAIVLGAGIAGCSAAYHLSLRGWRVTLIEQQPRAAMDCSSNPAAVIKPYTTGRPSPRGSFYETAFNYACGFYGTHLPHCQGAWDGMVELPKNPEHKEKLTRIAAQLPDALAHWISATDASAKLGITVADEALHYPHAGWVQMPSLCEHLLAQCNQLTTHYNTSITELTPKGDQWHLTTGEQSFTTQHLILANGMGATALLPLELQPMSGQAITISDNSLTIPAAYEGYAIPHQGTLTLGSTYHHKAAEYRAEDTEELLRRADSHLGIGGNVVSHWLGTRTTGKGRLPAIGALQLGGAPPLYTSLAHGSRATLSAPFAGEWLASLVSGDIQPVTQSVTKALNPQRMVTSKISL